MKELQSYDGNDDYCKVVENNRRQRYKDSCTDNNGVLHLRTLKGGSSHLVHANYFGTTSFVSELRSVPW